MRRAGLSQADIDQHQSTMRALRENLSGDGYVVTTHGMYHLNLTDAPLLLPAALLDGQVPVFPEVRFERR